uniref:hypothetical protein n=1 Tax=Sphaeromyxa zaharoni TaxID=275449 RepID=UPI003001A713
MSFIERLSLHRLFSFVLFLHVKLILLKKNPLFIVYVVLWHLFMLLIMLPFYGMFPLTCWILFVGLFVQVILLLKEGYKKLDYNGLLDGKVFNVGITLLALFDVLVVVSLLYYVCFILLIPVYYGGVSNHEMAVKLLLFATGQGLCLSMLLTAGLLFSIMSARLLLEGSKKKRYPKYEDAGYLNRSRKRYEIHEVVNYNCCKDNPKY